MKTLTTWPLLSMQRSIWATTNRQTVIISCQNTSEMPRKNGDKFSWKKASFPLKWISTNDYWRYVIKLESSSESKQIIEFVRLTACCPLERTYSSLFWNPMNSQKTDSDTPRKAWRDLKQSASNK
eukprot:33732_4